MNELVRFFGRQRKPCFQGFHRGLDIEDGEIAGEQKMTDTGFADLLRKQSAVLIRRRLKLCLRLAFSLC